MEIIKELKKKHMQFAYACVGIEKEEYGLLNFELSNWLSSIGKKEE